MIYDQTKIDKSINRFIEEIRQLSQLSNDEMRIILKKIAAEKPQLFELFILEANKKTLKEIKKMIKDIKSNTISHTLSIGD